MGSSVSKPTGGHWYQPGPPLPYVVLHTGCCTQCSSIPSPSLPFTRATHAGLVPDQVHKQGISVDLTKEPLLLLHMLGTLHALVTKCFLGSGSFFYAHLRAYKQLVGQPGIISGTMAS
eukprot:14056327-Ditylum_brightwellii.AAC.1